jgi:hypothetical protein
MIEIAPNLVTLVARYFFDPLRELYSHRNLDLKTRMLKKRAIFFSSSPPYFV